MPLRPTILAVIAVAMLGLASGARAADPVTYTVIPSDTDAAILDTPSPTPGTRGNHLVWLPPEARRVGKLLVFLPTGGTTNVPTEFTELGTVAARLAYHTIILAYRNEAPVAALSDREPAGLRGRRVAAAEHVRASGAPGDPHRRSRIARRERGSGEQHREPPQQTARLPQGQLSRGRLVAVRH